jgi:branched-chain amino acid transport system permease protein
MTSLRIGLLCGALLLLLLFPFFGSQFWVSTVAPRVFILGTMALSLTFLTSTVGLVSFAQAAVAGAAAYTLALLSPNTSMMGTVVPWPLAVAGALVSGTLFGALVGWVSARSSGIYLLMITLAISVSAFYFFSQNTDIFNGFDGINGIRPPTLFDVNLREAKPFYFVSLATAAACAVLVITVNRTAFGLHLHALRNAPRRLAALGFDPVLMRVAAFGFAGAIASAGGVLNTWYSGQVSPGSVDVAATVNLLVISVLGGIHQPLGAFAGALVFVLLENFAIEIVSRERFNLVIGLVFIVVVLFAKNGLVGMFESARAFIKHGAKVAPGSGVAVAPNSRRHSA